MQEFDIKQNNKKRETKQQDSLSVQLKTGNIASPRGNRTPAPCMTGRDTHHCANEEDVTIDSKESQLKRHLRFVS